MGARNAGAATGGWERRLLEVFDDLEQQAAGLHLQERDAEVADVAAAEYAAVDLEARLRASTGDPVSLRLQGGWQCSGALLRVGPQWALLGGEGARWLVSLTAVVLASGTAGRAAPAATRSVADAVSLRSLLRRVGEEGRGGPEGGTRVHLVDGHRVDGSLARVGADFVEVVTVAGRAPTLVTLAGLAAVRWSAW